MTVTPARAALGASVEIDLTVVAVRAAGALAYRLDFGDGRHSENVLPQFCQAVPSARAHEAWHFTHRYSRPGVYRVGVFARVNCTDERAVAAVSVKVV
ncbi:MAG TPA: hypothetical protein VKG82_06885 [Solirubrobacteraceae bacterium]|nr:hypothetical protein [Solirubrobacteraceae bacterium]